MTRPATETTLPPQAAFNHAVLRHLSRHPDGDGRHNVYEAVADLLGLSDAQRSERLVNLPHLRYRHRTGFAVGVLRNAGYLDMPAAATWRLTHRGTELLTRYPDGFDEETGRRVVREGRSEVDIPADGIPSGSGNSDEPPAQQTPEERIDNAMEEIHRSLARDLLERITQAPPIFFEQLVLELLHALGYGATKEDLQHVGRSGDGGIDGVIALDRLGFETIGVQAKRWQGSVGRPEVQGFYGALAGRRARKGVMITTSSFTRDATQFAHQMSETIVLVDGPRLTSLMIEHGVGVSHYRMLRLPKLDDDYFNAD